MLPWSSRWHVVGPGFRCWSISEQYFSDQGELSFATCLKIFLSLLFLLFPFMSPVVPFPSFSAYASCWANKMFLIYLLYLPYSCMTLYFLKSPLSRNYNMHS